MTFFEAILLGLIQGLTEFLPISSSAHVQIAQELLGLSELTKPQLTAFIATIQIGTEAAVVIYFFKMILEILGSWFRTGFRRWSKQEQSAKLGWLIIVGTLPIAILGVLFRDFVENDVRQLWVIGVTLILWAIPWAGRCTGKKAKGNNGPKFQIGIGFWYWSGFGIDSRGFKIWRKHHGRSDAGL